MQEKTIQMIKSIEDELKQNLRDGVNLILSERDIQYEFIHDVIFNKTYLNIGRKTSKNDIIKSLESNIKFEYTIDFEIKTTCKDTIYESNYLTTIVNYKKNYNTFNKKYTITCPYEVK